MKMTLHHFAYNIRPGRLEITMELFEKLGCKLAYRQRNARWCMLKQKTIPIDIQLIETDHQPVDITKKINTHIAFLSGYWLEVIEKIKKWSLDKNIEFRQGGWSDKELWFDLPDVFINFVVEIMHISIVE